MGLTAPRTRSGLFVVALCFLTIVADGYDLIVYGATVPNLLAEPQWHMTAATAGAIGSWTLAGLMVGFLLAGPMTDRIGRRKVMMIGILWFSIGSAICALAQSPEFLGAARFVTGIGLGGVVPSAVALTVEYAPKTRRQLYNGLTLTGYSLGGIIAALAALALLPDHSWRLLYGLAALYLLILPVMYFYLPESVNYLILRGRTDDARRVASRYGLDFDSACREHTVEPAEAAADGAGGRGYRLLLTRPYVIAAALFVITCFCSQLIVYGLNTWLPQLMRKAGYPLGSSLQFLLVLQLGAVVGTLGGSLLADRFGSKRVIVASFLVGGVSLLALSRPLDVGYLMLAVAGAGLGTVGTSTLTYGYVAVHFPASCRGSAVGAAMGLARAGAILGPLIGGWIAGSALGVEWNFYAFALPAFVAATVVSLIGRTKPVSGSASPEQIRGGAELPEPIN
ncbi:MFS transporter [Nocardia africana]|uniref:MFS transporter n=1 Tax=Nocardia africana TaxID=134964 RepID=A0ABW6NI10_9NOCA